MTLQTIAITLTDTAEQNAAVALIVPLGIETEFQSFQSLTVPKGWDATVVAEGRSHQRAVVVQPASRVAFGTLLHSFSTSGPSLTPDAFRPEGTPITTAAAELAQDAMQIARAAGGGTAGIAAIVADTSARFSYGDVPMDQRWYYGRDSVPIVACASGNCIDINTYLVAALRAAGYEAAYLTCYFFDDDPQGIASGMHCWVRTRHRGVTQDWDIAHFKKAGRDDVRAMMNPIPGRRFALCHGRDHVYLWQGIEIRLSTPSRPMWVREDGTAIWGDGPVVELLT